MTDEIPQLLESLHLGRIAEIFDVELVHAERNRLSYQDFVARLLRAQQHPRQETARPGPTERAALPEPWTLESFPFQRQPGVSPRQIRALADLDFIAQAENIVFIGPTGVGKTHLATGLLRKALQSGHRGLLLRAPELFDQMYASLADHSSRKLLDPLVRVDVLVVDDIDHLELRPELTNIFFKLIDERHAQRPTIITTNLDYSEWASFLGNRALVEAVLSRLLLRCHTVRIDGPSLREPQG